MTCLKLGDICSNILVQDTTRQGKATPKPKKKKKVETTTLLGVPPLQLVLLVLFHLSIKFTTLINDNVEKNTARSHVRLFCKRKVLMVLKVAIFT